ncbi:hypothetical protein CPBP_01168 [Candidatus Bodocaedibacter vickermanii]|uniref:Uncharacterized protein n=1 Tax=Candidatus Bodocaedibacter vickermanii TaxID=2741701 RepID=A0A7L9RUY7_9PROT|nr:hypothetical protein CPBP_01168 [Candidatus Paracaedibacteraceae bacterium 'Lake Konstanz']
MDELEFKFLRDQIGVSEYLIYSKTPFTLTQS